MKVKNQWSFIALVASLLMFPILASAKTDTTVQRSNSPTPANASPGSINASGDVVVRQSAVDAPVGTPTRAIQDLETKMDGYKTGANLTPSERERNIQLKKDALNGTFDLRELCRLALDKNWAPLSAAEQNDFVNLMTQLLEKKGILSKEQSKTQGKKYLVKYLGDTYLDPTKMKARTRTQINVPKENVEVSIDYKLIKKGDWKIFDVIVDDASLVDNYKYQFNNIITKHGYPELVNRMKKKLNEMDAKA